MEIFILALIGLVLLTRFVETLLFIKRVSKVCHKYDWKVVEDNDLLLLEILKGDDYYVTNEWSAYNFLYLKGPSPLNIFLSLKPMTIENIYNKEAVNRLKEYEII